MTSAQRLAILCGGGPAPGLNSVISAAAIRARLAGIDVLGVREGFKWLMVGDTSQVQPLEIEEVSRIHFAGGSLIGISRANPTRDTERLETVVRTLRELNVDKLITIGGDDTAFSAMKVAEYAQRGLQVAHVPKTIDNDLDLPHGISTFGYQTARHLGVQIVENLMTDAKTTGRWYLVVTMGRKAGHLALGIGKAVGATITLIPEEYGSQPVRMADLVDVLAGSVIKRLAEGHRDGTAVLAEGLAEFLAPEDLEQFGPVERDEHGHIRLAEVDLGATLKSALARRLKDLGLSPTLVAKDIGYELRCAAPIPFDMEYTRDLGYCAAKFLIQGGSNAMITLQDGHFVPIPFTTMLDPTTGRTRIRLVDITSEQYGIARRYMVRLRRDDFTDAATVARLAGAANLTPEAFRSQFGYLVTNEAPPLSLPVVA
jgi:ATP-dependent phosphofructokinase / diphosphate-dependent phosphofructokinase